jgi:hypothetical protein
VVATRSCTTGGLNTANGENALSSNIDGSFNTAVGQGALLQNTAGDNNTAVGVGALAGSTGSNNIAIGFTAGSNIGSSGNIIAIGSPGDDVDGGCYIGNIRDVATGGDAVAVVIDSTGKLGTIASSRKFKKQIKPMDRVSEAILALRPVTFHYKNDKTNTPQFGLIAEDVANVNPDLVVRDKNGEIYTVRYEAVNAMLLNEFLKEHRRVEEQDCKIEEQQATIAEQRKDFEATITELKKEMESVVARLKEQDAKIQRVSDQYQVASPAVPVVVRNQ